MAPTTEPSEGPAAVVVCVVWRPKHLPTCLLPSDLHPWPGGVPGLCQPEAQGEITEACWAAGAARWQPESDPKETSELQAERRPASEVLPGEGAHHDCKLASRGHNCTRMTFRPPTSPCSHSEMLLILRSSFGDSVQCQFKGGGHF